MLDNTNKRISSILSIQEVFSLVTKDKNLNEDVLSCTSELLPPKQRVEFSRNIFDKIKKEVDKNEI